MGQNAQFYTDRRKRHEAEGPEGTHVAEALVVVAGAPAARAFLSYMLFRPFKVHWRSYER